MHRVLRNWLNCIPRWVNVFAAAGLMLTLIACGSNKRPDDAPPKQEMAPIAAVVTPLGTASSGGLSIEFKKTADWASGGTIRGFTAEITVLNETGNDINPWQLEFDFLGDIASFWNATFHNVEQHYVIDPVDWNQVLRDGQARSIGFSGTYDLVFSEPTAYRVNGIEIGAQEPAIPVNPSCTLQFEFVKTADWLEPDGSRGFVAQIYLTNTGQAPITWSLGVSLNGDVSAAWNAEFTVDGDGQIVFIPGSWNARLLPEETVSFGLLGSYSGFLDDPVIVPCPGEDGQPEPTEEDPADVAYRLAYAALSPDEKAQVDSGRLVYNGFTFIPRSPLLRPTFPSNGVLGPQSVIRPFQTPQGQFECPLEGVDSSGTPKSYRDVDDWGTFELYGTQPGTTNFPISRVEFSAILPPASQLHGFTDTNQVFYMYIAGWGDAEGASSFDAGINFSNNYYALFTNRFVETIPEAQRWTAHTYRLANLDEAGNVLPHTDPSPFHVDLTMEILQDDHIVLTATPRGNTVWWDPHISLTDPNPPRPRLLIDENGNSLSLVLGGSEVGQEYYGGDAHDEYPAQRVPGVRADGVANRVSLQINIAVKEGKQIQPHEGTRVDNVQLFGLSVNDVPWDVSAEAGTDGIYTFHVRCPSGEGASGGGLGGGGGGGGGATHPDGHERDHPVYILLGGNTASPTAADAFTLNMYITTPTVHGCDPDESGYFERCPEDEPGADENIATLAGSWGDPHISTFDNYRYTFMAVGDYILARSTIPGDDFMVQGRFRPFSGSQWHPGDGLQWSANEAVAMNVHGTIVEFYAVADFTQPLVIIDGEEAPAGNYSIPVSGGGTVTLNEDVAEVSWSDGTSLSAQLHSSPSGDEIIAGAIRLSASAARWGSLHGLYGSNDGRLHNDLRLPNGAVLNITHLDSAEVSRLLYTGPFRDSWLVQSHESLFSRGFNRYDPFYPTEVISLEDLNPALVAIAEAACHAHGVSTPDILSRCMLDIANTGDETFAALAAAADPATPGIHTAPSTVYQTQAAPVTISAHPRGTPENAVLLWEASQGNLHVDGHTATFTPPSDHGIYEITVTVVGMPQITAVTTVSVADELAIVPNISRLYGGDSIELVAYGLDSQPVTWSAPSGTIQPNGRRVTYTAPNQGGDRFVQVSLASAPAIATTALVQVFGTELSPSIVTLPPGSELTLTWLNADHLDIIWETTGGQLEANGTTAVFKAPPAEGEYIVTARSVDDSTLIATATLIVEHPFCCVN